MDPRTVGSMKCNAGGDLPEKSASPFLQFTTEETEAQRGRDTCPMSQEWLLAASALEPGSPDSQTSQLFLFQLPQEAGSYLAVKSGCACQQQSLRAWEHLRQGRCKCQSCWWGGMGLGAREGVLQISCQHLSSSSWQEEREKGP